MDLSQDYIKMCKKCQKELNPYWKWEAGYIYSVKGTPMDYTQMPKINESEGVRHISPMIWLPRQDQLLEIIDFEGLTLDNSLWDDAEKKWMVGEYENNGEFYPITNRRHEGYDSPEKALLVAVMYREHSKVWSGEDWITC